MSHPKLSEYHMYVDGQVTLSSLESEESIPGHGTII